MSSICIINNYNYARYIGECIESALQQVHPFDKILIVDDGSTDNSKDIIDAYAKDNPRIEVVYKENKGQLSCFNVARDHIKDEDLVFFLDSDDVFPPDYTQQVIQQRQNHPADFYFCEPTQFQSPRSPLTTCLSGITDKDFTWEISTHTTRAMRIWVGSATTCLVVTGALYRTIFPYTPEHEWRTRADDLVVFGAGIVGASKRYLPSLTIGYRVHQNNAFHGRQFSEAYEIRRLLEIERYFNTASTLNFLSLDKKLLEAGMLRENALVPPHLRQRFQLPTNEELVLQRSRGLKRTIKKIKIAVRGPRL